MPNQIAPAILRGLTGGVTSEKSILNIMPTSLEEDSRNIEVLRDGSFRPRRAVDFVGASSGGDYMHTLRTSTTSVEASQEAPSAIYAAFKTSDGEIVEKDIIFQNLVFNIYAHGSLANYDAPAQTIDPGARVNTTQKFFSVSLVFADNRVFFAGRKIQPGYLYLDSDNTTLNIVYLSGHVRDLDNATAKNSRVKLNGKVYQCIEAHTSAATDVTTTDSYGELVFNRYWMEVDNTGDISGISAWAAATSYTTHVQRLFSKYATLSSDNPHTLAFWLNRLWWATDSKIYYSWISVDVEDSKTSTTPTGAHEYSLFMQEADPFETADPNPVSSDGGVITPDAGRIWQIINSEDAIYVGTSTQVEEIRGATASFTHTDFKKGVVINEGINGIDNMTLADNRLIVFANNNIFASANEQRFSQSELTRFAKLASKKIKDYYVEIPKLNKGTARAVYSPTKEKIYYFHNGNSLAFDASYRNEPGQNGYSTNVLVIDLSGITLEIDQTQEQFVQNHIEIYSFEDHASSGGTYIAYAYIAAPTTSSSNNVVIGADNVVVGANSVVVSGLSGSQQGSDEVVILAMSRATSGGTVTVKGGIAKLSSDNLQDWYSDATLRTDYACNADLGTQTFEDLTMKNGAKYLVFVLEKLATGTGSCLLRTAYNFSAPTTAGEGTGKTSDTTEIYQDTKKVAGGTVSLENYKAVTYKHRVRGRGNAFQISISNTAGKDFKILGWGQLMRLGRR